uniref:N-acetyltransferase domain-containing protein n=1 Tax=viral metagenome TaxID=1070528 RepID=A0A6M3IVR1_9ZZZZ
MIRIEPLDPKHIDMIEKTDMDSLLAVSIEERAYRRYATNGPAVTIFDDDVILALGGVVKFWNGVGEAWTMISPAGRRKKKYVFKYMLYFLNQCLSVEGFHRIQAKAIFGNKKSHGFIMKLGFIPEGTLINYGPNKENFISYVRF